MYRILVADDEPIERAVIEKIIRKLFPEQLEIVLAVNGREAVQLYKERKCSIALLDIAMPGIDGLDAAEEIVKLDESGVIIFLTAYDEFNYAKRAFSVRALDYLLKPTSEEELSATLEEAIDMVEKKRALMKLITGTEMSGPGEKKISANAEKQAEAEKQQSTEGQGHTEEQMDENIKLNAVADSIYAYIKSHYQDEIALQDVAGHLNYSDAYFCKLFKQCFGKSFRVFLTEYRIDLAKELLSDISINIKDIGVKVGYQDSNYFTRVFKRVEGVTPSEYRLNALKGISHPMSDTNNR